MKSKDWEDPDENVEKKLMGWSKFWSFRGL